MKRMINIHFNIYFIIESWSLNIYTYLYKFYYIYPDKCFCIQESIKGILNYIGSIYYFIDTQFKFRFIQFLHCIANISVTKLEKNYRAVWSNNLIFLNFTISTL